MVGFPVSSSEKAQDGNMHVFKSNPNKIVKDPNTKYGDMPTNFSSSFRAQLHFYALGWSPNWLWFLAYGQLFYRPTFSYYVIDPVSRPSNTATAFLSSLLPYLCFLLLRLIFHFKPNFSFLFYVDWQSAWQPSPPHQPPLEMGPQAGTVLVISISQSGDELIFPHDLHH